MDEAPAERAHRRRRGLYLLAGITLFVVLPVLAGANRVPIVLPRGARADRIVVHKAAHTLTLFRGEQALATFPIALGREPIGAKEHEGDCRTPEGAYVIDAHNPSSAFHRALHIGYPRPDQIEAARARGVDPGGDVMIHGLRNGLGFVGRLHRAMDWTAGCIALTNPEMDAVYDAVPDGTPIVILP